MGEMAALIRRLMCGSGVIVVMKAVLITKIASNRLINSRNTATTRQLFQVLSANRLKLNQPELLWADTKHSLSLLGGCGPSLRLEEDTVTASSTNIGNVLVETQIRRDRDTKKTDMLAGSDSVFFKP